MPDREALEIASGGVEAGEGEQTCCSQIFSYTNSFQPHGNVHKVLRFSERLKIIN